MKAKLPALAATIACLIACAIPTAAQKPAPPTAPQQKLQDQVDALEKQAQELKEKTDRVAMEKDYIERIQKETKDYYDKAFAAQLGVVAIMGIFVAAVGKFGVDHIVASKLAETSAVLRADFGKQLADKLQTFKDSSTSQLKTLEQDLSEKAKTQARSLDTTSSFIFAFSIGVSLSLTAHHEPALDAFRQLLPLITKNRSLLPQSAPEQTVTFLFMSLRASYPQTFATEAQKELQNPLYKELGPQLAATALQVPELADVLRKLKN